MRAEDFLRAIGEIDDDLISEAMQDGGETVPAAKKRIKPTVWIRYAAASVAVVLLCTVAWTMRDKVGITMNDAAVEVAPDCYYSYTADEYNAAPEKTEGFDPDAPTDDNGTAVLLRMYFFANGVWSESVALYAGGMPDGTSLVSSYLNAAGAPVSCVGCFVSVTATSAAAAETSAGTATVTLTGDPGEDTLRGLVRTVGETLSVQYVRILTEDGGALSIGGVSPAGGFPVRETVQE